MEHGGRNGTFAMESPLAGWTAFTSHVHPADDAIQIQSQDTILALITTCRTFHDVFSPFLRRKFGFNLTAVPTVQLRRKALPTSLQNTQEFEVLLKEFEGNKALWTYHESQNGDYTSLVVRMLKEMTNLKSFRFD
jgi:hypothetical protein